MLVGPVFVSVPGEADSLSVLRLVASEVGRLLGFGYDAIEDSRLAVNEAASMLVAAGGGDIECRIGSGDEAMVVEMALAQPIVPWPPADWEGSLGQLVLSRVVDGLHLGEGCSLSFRLSPS